MAARAYYNEHDKYAAAWLRNLIAAGHIAPGDVDERSIEDVTQSDLRGYTQHHFFAGIGVWSYALRRAGWTDDRPVWTGSCPCQPFSAAGKGAGFDDERHLWPAFYHLIQEHHEWCRSQQRPIPAIIGEQVASKDADTWIDLVQADLETLGYTFGAVAFPSAGIGAPHIRDRTYWVADPDDKGLEGRKPVRQRSAECIAGASGLAGRLGNSGSIRRQSQSSQLREHEDRMESGGREQVVCVEAGSYVPSEPTAASPTNGLWADADWLFCRDGKWRPVEPCTFPLAHGATSRVGRLRAYGNAINAEAAQVFIESVMQIV